MFFLWKFIGDWWWGGGGNNRGGGGKISGFYLGCWFYFKMNFEKSLFYILCDYNVNFM